MKLSKEPYKAIHDERHRAHMLWSPTGDSMEVLPHDSPRRLPILVEEVGEVAKALNEDAPMKELRMELIQVAAMAAAWIAALDRMETWNTP